MKEDPDLEDLDIDINVYMIGEPYANKLRAEAIEQRRKDRRRKAEAEALRRSLTDGI